MWPNPQETAALVTFTEEILNGKLDFCAVYKTGTLARNGLIKPLVYITSIEYPVF